MKWFHWCLIIVFCSTTYFFISRGSDNRVIMEQRYKRALDAGCYAASKYRPYSSVSNIDENSMGFGEGYNDTKNIIIDKNESLKWFYRMFFKNISMSDINQQNKIKKYIPMKAIVAFDRLYIADLNDNWIYDKPYTINYKGSDYTLTLSEQIYDITAGIWLNIDDVGMSEDERIFLLNKHIRDELTYFLNTRENKESTNYYRIKVALDNFDQEQNSFDGVSFIVFCEGIPMPSLNPFKSNQKLYAFTMGGSELVRK